jgi:hypothetical protein
MSVKSLNEVLRRVSRGSLINHRRSRRYEDEIVDEPSWSQVKTVLKDGGISSDEIDRLASDLGVSGSDILRPYDVAQSANFLLDSGTAAKVSKIVYGTTWESRSNRRRYEAASTDTWKYMVSQLKKWELDVGIIASALGNPSEDDEISTKELWNAIYDNQVELRIDTDELADSFRDAGWQT